MTKPVKLGGVFGAEVIIIAQDLFYVIVVPELEMLGQIGNPGLTGDQSFKRAEDPCVFEIYRAFRWRCQACDDLEKIAFTRTGLAHDRQTLPLALRKFKIL